MSEEKSLFYNKILVPTDGSIHSLKAAEHAVELGRKCGSLITLLHVLEQPSVEHPVEIHGDSWIEVGDAGELRKRGEEVIKKTKQVFDKSGVPVEIKSFFGGHPRQAIIEFAEKENFNLIVMGGRGLGGVRRAMLGSVADGVIRHAPCPVLIVR